LDEWAQIMGIEPAHFNGATADPIAHSLCSECVQLWPQTPGQNSAMLSREEVALAIASAEQDIESYLGVPLKPTLKCKTFAYQPCGSPSALVPTSVWDHRNWGLAPQKLPSYYVGDCPVFSWGQETYESLAFPSKEEGTISFVDLDGDNFSETALLIAYLEDPEVVPRPCEVTLFYPDGCGDPLQQICPLRNVVVDYSDDTGLGEIRIEVWAWQLIRPELWSAPVGGGDGNAACQVSAIDLLDSNVYVEELEVCHHTFKPWTPMVEFGVEQTGQICGCDSDGCHICSPQTFPGCLLAGTRAPGFVVPVPARWDDEECGWVAYTPLDLNCLGVTPSFVRIHYWHGCIDDGCDPSDPSAATCHALKQVTAILAAARLPKTVCACDCTDYAWFDGLKRDLSYSTRSEGTFFLSQELVNNPFGTRSGEIQAYRKLKLLKSRLCQTNRVSGGSW
jgi:hypothetical protein